MLTQVLSWLEKFAWRRRDAAAFMDSTAPILDVDRVCGFGRFVAAKQTPARKCFFVPKKPSDIPGAGYVSWLIVRPTALHVLYDPGQMLWASGSGRVQFQHLHEKVFLHEIVHAILHMANIGSAVGASALPVEEFEAWFHSLTIRAWVVATAARIQKVLGRPDQQWLAA